MEFIDNIIAAIANNLDAIVAFFSSATFAAIVAVVINLIRTIGTVKNNTEKSEALNSALAKNKMLETTVTNAVDVVTNISDSIDKTNITVRKELQEVKENNVALNNMYKDMTNKLSAMLDVMSIVYSNLKDDDARNNVLNIISNAKYSEAATKAELEKQVETLKAELMSLSKQIEDKVSAATDAVKNIVNPTEPVIEQETDVQRY